MSSAFQYSHMFMTTKERLHNALAYRWLTFRALIRNELNLGSWRRDQRIALPIGGELPVIFCTWRRIERLRQTLEQLAAQEVRVQACIWNNSPDRDAVDAAAAAAGIPVSVFHSSRNIGGFGRFYLARRAAEAGHSTVVFVDDDQEFGPQAIGDLLSAHRPRSLSGWWAFRFTGPGYGDRVRGPARRDRLVRGYRRDDHRHRIFSERRCYRCPRRLLVRRGSLALLRRWILRATTFPEPGGVRAAAEDAHALYLSLGRTKWNLPALSDRRAGTQSSATAAPRGRPAVRRPRRLSQRPFRNVKRKGAVMKAENPVSRAVGPKLTVARAMIRNERRLMGWNRGQRTAMSVGDRLPVIFCTWRRLDRLARTLEQLARQDLPVQALIWNNSPDRRRVDAVARSSDLPVAVHHSSRNIGSFGRFYLARNAVEQGHHSVVFIDDDQDFGPGTMRQLLGAHRPRSLSGWWALGLRSAAYSSRYRAAPGESASLMGVGGMIADAAVFLDARLYRCPRRYFFLDDIWLSYVAQHLCGYELFRISADFKFDESADDEHALYHELGQTKGRFLRYLIRKGWNPVQGASPAPARPAGAEPVAQARAHDLGLALSPRPGMIAERQTRISCEPESGSQGIGPAGP